MAVSVESGKESAETPGRRSNGGEVAGCRGRTTGQALSWCQPWAAGPGIRHRPSCTGISKREMLRRHLAEHTPPTPREKQAQTGTVHVQGLEEATLSEAVASITQDANPSESRRDPTNGAQHGCGGKAQGHLHLRTGQGGRLRLASPTAGCEAAGIRTGVLRGQSAGLTSLTADRSCRNRTEVLTRAQTADRRDRRSPERDP